MVRLALGSFYNPRIFVIGGVTIPISRRRGEWCPRPYSCSAKFGLTLHRSMRPPNLEGSRQTTRKSQGSSFVWGKKEKATCTSRGQVRTCNTRSGRKAAERATVAGGSERPGTRGRQRGILR